MGGTGGHTSFRAEVDGPGGAWFVGFGVGSALGTNDSEKPSRAPILLNRPQGPVSGTL